MRLERPSRQAVAALAAALLGACTGSSADKPSTPAWMADRARQEAAMAKASPVFTGFGFADRRAESGITFQNRVVDDAGRFYKAVHYDHGMGVCAADVDGDGLLDLYFVTQLGTNQLWRNLGGGKFADITKSAGLEVPDAIAVGCAFADVDNDGKPDLFVTTVRHGNHLFRNDGGGHFTDVTAAAGVGYVGHSSGAMFLDYDGDGLLDLFVANVGRYTTDRQGAGGYYVGLADAFQGHLHHDRGERSILYRNLGGFRFRDVTKEVGLEDESWSGDAAMMDANGDGRPDIYLANMQGPDHLWLNEGGRRFRDATATWFARTPWGAMGLTVADFDGDGGQDLYVTDMHSDMFFDVPPEDWLMERQKSNPSQIPDAFVPEGKDKFVFGNALFVGGGERGGKPVPFEEASDRMGAETYWPWGPSAADLNADGWTDLFVINGMNFPFRYQANSVLLNDAGKKFLPSEFTLGVEPRAGGATEQVWYKADCSPGSQELPGPGCKLCLNPKAGIPGCHREPDGSYTVMGALGSRSAVIADLDNDGDLDIVTNDFNGVPQVLISNLGERRPIHWLKVRLEGRRSNREGLGAVVTVVAGDGSRQVRQVDGKSGYLSQSDMPLYFGLGANDKVTSVEVRWPSGIAQRVAGTVAPNTTLTVTESGGR
ncbi:MAG: CRTAC1 family protein [Gemmatimonadota bacterium]|nr:CRTAC1 family protein [Gemmatimonadota bacterium]